VVWVTWKNAMAFCRWLSAKTGHSYSLPTEAPWEYAWRAGSHSRFGFGDSDVELLEYAWARSNSKGHPNPVGRKRPNSFRLYDMHGDVWEACLDWYGEDSYSKGSTENPSGPSSGEYRVFRGGCWYCLPGYCRSANRIWDEPGNAEVYFGFRVVRLSRQP
jgi:eukaryotic-like serine/threonine-protein kinase